MNAFSYHSLKSEGGVDIKSFSIYTIYTVIKRRQIMETVLSLTKL